MSDMIIESRISSYTKPRPQQAARNSRLAIDTGLITLCWMMNTEDRGKIRKGNRRLT